MNSVPLDGSLLLCRTALPRAPVQARVAGEGLAAPLLVACKPELHTLPMPLPASRWRRVPDTAADALPRDAASDPAPQAWT